MKISQLWGNTFVNIFVFSFSMICEKTFIDLISNFCDQDSFCLIFKDVLRLSIHWPRPCFATTGIPPLTFQDLQKSHPFEEVLLDDSELYCSPRDSWPVSLLVLHHVVPTGFSLLLAWLLLSVHRSYLGSKASEPLALLSTVWIVLRMFSTYFLLLPIEK